MTHVQIISSNGLPRRETPGHPEGWSPAEAYCREFARILGIFRDSHAVDEAREIAGLACGRDRAAKRAYLGRKDEDAAGIPDDMVDTALAGHALRLLLSLADALENRMLDGNATQDEQNPEDPES
jgi:hypothetical protein